MNDDEILSGFTSLQEAMQRGLARLEQAMLRRYDALEERLAGSERSRERAESHEPFVSPSPSR